jgi:hypothetical protein
MAKQKDSPDRVGGRDTRTGQFVPVRETERKPGTTQRERIPMPGAAEGKDRPREYRTSPSGRFVEREQVQVTTSKGERVVLYRDSETGRYTTTRSANRIGDTSRRAKESLKRLAKK